MAKSRGSQVDLASASGDFKRIITRSMTHAADQAKVPIISDEIAVAIKHDIIVANAIVAETASTAAPPPVMFAYLSMPGHACAQLLPIGFYTIEERTDRLTGAPHARFVSADGKTALEHVPLNRDLARKQTPEQGYSAPLQFTADVKIEQTGVAYAQTTIVLHRVKCRERSGWEWWEWLTITIDPDGPV